MELSRFDTISRMLATRSTRRRLGAVGVLGGLGLALRPRAGSGQAGQDRTCDFDLVATVASGPHAGQEFSGGLTLPIGADGEINGGSFSPEAGPPATVTGQATDRALRLRIDLGIGGVLALSGVARRRVTGCRGEMNGIFSGPAMGDLGTWSVVRRSASTASQTSTATVEAGSTRTPCPSADCGQTFVLNPDTCECDCLEPYDRCGDLCCPGGSDCIDPASGSCQCPAGTEICNDVCVLPCQPGSYREPSTCECLSGCPPLECPFYGLIGQQLDPSTCLCVDICVEPFPYFCGGTCNAEPMVFCGSSCAVAGTSATNPDNCGGCGVKCPPGVPCIGGSCQCPPGTSVCPTGCYDLANDPSSCGDCFSACVSGACQNGVCVD